jgi:hypothetical protein
LSFVVSVAPIMGGMEMRSPMRNEEPLSGGRKKSPPCVVFARALSLERVICVRRTVLDFPGTSAHLGLQIPKTGWRALP